MNAPQGQRGRAVAGTGLALVLALSLAGCSKAPSTLPDVSLHEVRGGTFSLRSQPATPLLLSFLQTVPDTADTASRSQVVFLASMAHQYGPRGLRIAVVDGSARPFGSAPPLDAVRNASYDWHLDFPLLVDPDSHLARQLGVKNLPDTLLVAGDGRIVQEWRGLTRPAALALSIERLLSGPLARTPQ